MPRYLAVDFVFKAEQHYRSILNDLLLSVPEHLEHVESYVHHGKVVDTGYRRPWTKVRNKKFDVNADVPSSLCETAPNEIENFDTLILCEEEIEVVPSSNPCSQFDVSANAGQTKVILNPCHEEFHEVDIKNLLHSDKDAESKLEEPLCDDYLTISKKQIPTVDALCGRLKPKHVTDPFTTQHGTPISEDGFFRKRGENIFGETSLVDHFIKEEFQFEKSHSDEITLEEKLQYPFHQDNHDKPLTTCNSSELKSVLQLSPEKLSGEVKDITDMVKQLVTDLVKTIPSDVVNKCTAPEKTDDTWQSPTDTIQVFQQLNSHDMSGEEMNRSAMILESPVLLPKTQSDPIDLTMSLQDILNLQKLDKTDDKKLDLVNSKCRSSMEDYVWCNEKYFTDISVLRLPEVPVDQEELELKQNTIDHVKHTLNLSFLEGIRLLELELPWDPLVDTLESATNSSKQILRFENTEKKERRREIEVFEKVDLSSARGAPDKELSTVGLTGFQRTRDRIQNKLKGIPRFSATKQLRRLNNAQVIREANEAIYSQRRTENTATSETTTPSSKRMNTSMVTPSVDPIDTFMWMRNNVKGALTPAMLHGSAKRYKPVREISQEKSHHQKETNQSIKAAPKTGNPKADPQSQERNATSKPSELIEERKISKSHKPEFKTLEVPFTGEYLSLFEAIEDGAKPVVEEAVRNKILPSTHTFSTLTPEVTRFAIRQYEHNRQSSKNVDGMYTTLLGLHTLVTAAYLLLHCCLAPAIQALRVMCDKHPSLKDNGTLAMIYQLLCKQNHILSNQNKLHPKLSQLAQFVTSMINTSPDSVDMGCDAKLDSLLVLVACNKELQNILDDVQNVLTSVQGTKPVIITDTSNSVENLLTNPDVNFVVTFTRIVNEDFPWNRFTCVLEYDPPTGSALSKLRSSSEKHGMSYVALQSVIKPEAQLQTASVLNITSDDKRRETMPQVNVEQCSSPQQYIFIGSTTVTANSELLHSLESSAMCQGNNVHWRARNYSFLKVDLVYWYCSLARYNIQILERDYNAIGGKGHRLHFADIDVDVQTGIVLCSLLDLQSASTAEPLIVNLAVLSAKYTHCWLLLFTPSKGKRYAFGGSAMINVAKLYSSVSHLCAETFSLQVLMCESEDKVASVVKQVAVSSRTNAEQSGNLDWFDRSFLKYNMSKHEKFLLAFPCLNSFSAQVLLRKSTLSEILAASPEKLSSLNPVISPHTIKAFCEMKKDGGNMPTDHGDGLNREAGEINVRTETHDNSEGYSNSTSPEQKDFKLQIYSGARSDATRESEHEWSSISYEEHEVPDIETPERLDLANEYEVAEMEGSMSRIDAYPDKPSGISRAQRDQNEHRGRSWTESSGSHPRYLDSSEVQRRSQNMDLLHKGNLQQRQFSFVSHRSLESQGGKSRGYLDNKENEWSSNIGNSREEPGISLVRINRGRIPEIGGQSAYTADFFKESFVVKPNFSKHDVGNKSSGLWTQFNDQRSLGARVLKENQTDNNHHNRHFKESGPNIRDDLRAAVHYRGDEMMTETPRIHQPYTQPHHRTHKSVWKMPPRLPSIAAVTPSPRNPVYVHEFLEIGTQHVQRRTHAPQDSPPMDPDSDDDAAPVRWSHQPMFNRDRSEFQKVPNRRRSMPHNIPGPLRAGAAEYRHRMFDESESESTKKRRLTYKRIPGLKGGQTRLNFT